jgi:hypothetical protein
MCQVKTVEQNNGQHIEKARKLAEQLQMPPCVADAFLKSLIFTFSIFAILCTANGRMGFVTRHLRYV